MVGESMTQTTFDVAVIGAGFGGIGAGAMLQRMDDTSFVILEKAETVGGTWRDNTYPGCACDIPSHLYSLSFAPNPDWSRSYPQQPEIESYLERVTDDLDLRRSIRFGVEVRGITWDNVAQRWDVEATDGDVVHAASVIMATGPLSRPALPDIEGIDDFAGTMFHSARWRHDHDLAGERVGVIGTGASAVQFVPRIAPVAGEVTVFQRSAPWVLPRDDRPAPAWRRRLYAAVPFLQRLHRWRIYLRQEMLSVAFLGRGRAAQGAAQRVKDEVRAQIAASFPDPADQERLLPHYEPGCKRLLIANEWYPALARPDVAVCTTPIERIVPEGVRTVDGTIHEFDTIVFGTGFAASDLPGPMRITGLDGVDLAQRWTSGADTNLGISIDGYPNLFMLAGPNTGLGHNSIVFMIEAQLHHIRAAMLDRRSRRVAATQTTTTAVGRFYEEAQRRLQRTVWTSGCTSWYQSDSGRVDTLWPGTTIEYWWRTRRFTPGDYVVVPADSGQVPAGR